MSFIELPPEVRNLIYEHAFPSVRLLIATRDSDQALGHFRANEDDKDGSSVSINLLLTCRTVYNEAKLLVYTRSIFCFDSHTTLTSFLRRTPAQSRSVIQKVEFLQDLSGVAARNPTCAEVEIEFARWCVAYMEAERMMTGIRQLTFSATFDKPPSTFIERELEQEWIKCFRLSFVRLYDRVNVNIHPAPNRGPNSIPKHIDKCRRLADGLMTKQGRVQRDLEETKMALAQIQAAKKPLPILVLKVDKNKETRPIRSIKRTVALEGYTRLQSAYSES